MVLMENVSSEVASEVSENSTLNSVFGVANSSCLAQH